MLPNISFFTSKIIENKIAWRFTTNWTLISHFTEIVGTHFTATNEIAIYAEKKKKNGHFPILAGSHELRNTLDLTAPIHAITSALPLNFPCLFIYEGWFPLNLKAKFQVNLGELHRVFSHCTYHSNWEFNKSFARGENARLESEISRTFSHLSGHFSETNVAPNDITSNSSPLLFLIVYLMTSSPDSVLPKTSCDTTILSSSQCR